MLKIYKTTPEGLESISNITNGCWINAVGPTQEEIAQLENWVQGDLRPDLTLLLDLPVEVGLTRAKQRSEPDRFEIEKLQFFEKVRQAYLQIAAASPTRVKVINAEQPLDQVQQQITLVLTDFLQQHDNA